MAGTQSSNEPFAENDTNKNDNLNINVTLDSKSNLEDSEQNGKKSDKEVKRKPSPVELPSSDGALLGARLSSASQQATPRTPGGLGPARQDTLKDKERKIGHRRIDHGGQVTYKKIGTSQIMGSIQLGIQQAVGSLASKPELDVLIQDFYVVETILFPASGSQSTPAHPYSEFRFKVYAPIAFRHFRDLFRIAVDDYMVSLCNEPLRELSNPGASGSIFYLTNDDEFIIKTVQHKEADFLQKLLPAYYMNLNQNPRTLLPKFFGLYTYQCNAKNIRLIVMNNLVPTSVKMHQKYDLKGSTYKRKANKYERKKNSPTYKDLDFREQHPEGILLEAETYKALVNTIERDCRVLTSFKIMDYSLLVGIHNLDLAAKEKAERAERSNGRSGDDPGDGSGSDGLASSSGAGAAADSGFTSSGGLLNRSRSMNRQKLVAHSTAMESIQADADPIDEEDQVPPGGIPARNTKGERLMLFLGIIDILQSYRFKKKLEHTVKSMIHDGDTISVHRPDFYAQRFQTFMADKVFKRIPSPLRHSPSRRRGVSLRAAAGVPRPISQAAEGEATLSKQTSEDTAGSAAPASGNATSSSSGHGQPRPSGSGRGSTSAPPPTQEVVPLPPSTSTPPPTWGEAVGVSSGSLKSTGPVTSSPKAHGRISSSAAHVTTVAIQEDRTDVVRVSFYTSS